jgi:hypothetical protein
LLVAIAMVLGMLTAAATLSEKRLPYQVIAAALIIALGAWIDTDATNLTRPPQLYFSQTLIAFGTTLFIGPALVFGFQRVLARGADHLVTYIVLFNITQNVGGLAGSAFLGTYQIASMRVHMQALSEHLIASDPQVAARLQSGSSAFSAVIVDPSMRSAQGGSQLVQSMVREANVLAYIDVFRLVMFLSILAALYVAYLLVFNAVRRRRIVDGAFA